MPTPLFTISNTDEFAGATVFFSDGTPRSIASDNANFKAVRDGLLNESLTEDDLLHLIAPFEAVYKTLTRLSERVTRKGTKLMFDGDVVNNALSKFIIDLMNENDEASWKAYVAFMEKLYTNPSKASQEHLFHYIEKSGLQVTPDGDIVAYKGTASDGKSTHAGFGIVNGVEYQHDYLQNAVGTVVEIPRSMVNEDRNTHCSTGLHVGAFSYVTGYWSNSWPHMWLVTVNPRDVVAVPADFESGKIRVARYVVVADLGPTSKAKKIDGLVYAPEPTEPEADPDDGYEDPEDTTEEEPEPATPSNGSRVEEYKTVIKALIAQDPNVSLRRYRSKKVTANRRGEFRQAAAELGFKL